VFPYGPHASLIFLGDTGAGKTSTGKVMKGIVDPMKADGRIAPRSTLDMVIATFGTVKAYEGAQRVTDLILRKKLKHIRVSDVAIMGWHGYAVAGELLHLAEENRNRPARIFGHRAGGTTLLFLGVGDTRYDRSS
jgi:hypothetical protein